MLTETAQPIYIEGYHRPDYRDADDSVYDAISDIMSNGRTARLYRSLVRDKKIAVLAERAGIVLRARRSTPSRATRLCR